MTPQTILADLWAHGITLRLAADGVNLSAPAGRLTPAQRDLVLAHKAELIAFMVDARATTAQLLTAAMRCCDHHHDGEAGREQMRADCLATPQHLQADLLAHFREQYPTDFYQGETK